MTTTCLTPLCDPMTWGVWTEAGLVGKQSARLRSVEVGGAEDALGGPGASEDITRLEAGIATS